MTKLATETIDCPDCGSHINVEIYQSINVTLNPEAKEEILNQTFFQVTCDQCETVHPMEYSCLYHDMERRLMVYLLPGDPEEVKEHLGEFQDSAMELLKEERANYRLRIVNNNNELMEKIRIFDRGLNDKVVELLKLFYLAHMQEKDPDFQALAVYFDEGQTPEQQFDLIFLLPDGRAGTAGVSMDFYRMIEADYEKRFDEIDDQLGEHGFQIVDLEYAAACIK